MIEDFQAARRDPGLAVLEGFHAIKHALRFGATLTKLVGTDRGQLETLAAAVAPDLQERLAAELQIVSPEQFARLAPRAVHTEVLAIARRPAADLTSVLADPAPHPVVLLEEPRNLGNLGACIRVAAAAEAAGVLTTGRQDPWHADVLRGSAGLHFAVAVIRVDALAFGDRPLVAVDPDGEAFDPVHMPPRAVLAFGTERYGISDELMALAHSRVAIPMRAGVSSLNLATSVAAILFSWRLCAGRVQ